MATFSRACDEACDHAEQIAFAISVEILILKWTSTDYLVKLYIVNY